MKEEIRNIRQTFGLLNAMINSGEIHTKETLDQLDSAFISLTKIKRELEINKILKNDTD